MSNSPFPRIPRPTYQPQDMYPQTPPPVHPRASQAPQRPPQARHTPTLVQQQYRDPTDIGAQLHLTENLTPQIQRRVLEYYGNPQIKNIVVVAGQQVHRSSPYGVEITENGPTLHRTMIPWHRVHALHAAPGDPILELLTDLHTHNAATPA